MIVRVVGFFGFMSLVAVVGFLYWNRNQPLEPPEYPVAKQLRYSFELRNKTDQLIRDASFKAFAPVKQTASQNVVGIDATQPFEMSVDNFGNQLMTFSLGTMPPFGTKVIVITVAVNLSTTPNQLEFSEDIYLAESPKFEIRHEQVVSAAERFVASNRIEMGMAVSDWVASHIEYSGFNPQDQGALYALERRSGDCTEYSYLAATLMRSLDIPARVMGGFVLEGGSNVLRASDYHNWTELVSDRRWVLADAQKQKFNSDYENYIAFRVIEEDAASMSNSHRFLAFDPRLEVMMN